MSGHGLLERILNDQSIVTGMLIVIAVCSLTFAYRNLRPLAGRRHFPAHSRGPAAAAGDPWMSPPPRATAGHPSRTVHPEPAVHPAHAEDYPSWAITEAALRADGYPSWPERQEPAWDAGSAELAAWILSEANAQATEIRHEARDQVAASLADAKNEAAELLRQASDQAAAKLAAAELEAAEVRAAIMKLSAELGEAAANVTLRLPSPVVD
jgi:hypothetical protein